MSTEPASERDGAVADAGPPHRSNGPTLVVGLGEFGADIVDRLQRSKLAGGVRATGEPPPEDSPAAATASGLGLLSFGAELSLAEQTERIVAQAEGVLGLAAAVERAAPGDERRPMLDVLLVADLAEDAVATRLPELLHAAGARLLSRFSNIFPGHDAPNLTICPVVALIGVRRPDAALDAQEALAALQAQADKLTFRTGGASPIARVFVVEQQSSRYELRPSEVRSTVLAFLSLVLGTALRHQEPLRSFLRSSVDQAREQRIFASFGCATLELGLESYGVVRAAGDVVESMRQAASAAAGDQSVAAERLVPTAEAIEAELANPKSGDDLIELLRAHTPHVEFPPIGPHDTPEQVREVSYGWGWFDALENAVKAQVERLDEREMDEVTRVADERGLASLRRLEREVRRAIDDEERSGPHGWSSAQRLAEQVRERADREVSALSDWLKKEQLPEFPSAAQVESSFRDLREESTLRPRPRRMIAFGALAAVAIAALLHHVPKWVAVAVAQRRVPLLSLAPSSMAQEVGPWRYLLDPPYSFLWVLLVVGAAMAWWLRRYREKRHEALIAARKSLQAAVARYLTDEVDTSIRRYYESRLHFTLRAWALRALRRVRDVAAAEAQRLGAIAAALDRLARQFDADAKRLERQEASAGDLVYRTHVSAELLQASYEATRPRADLVDKLLADTEPPERHDEPPAYLLAARLREMVRPHLRPSSRAMAEVAGPAAVRFVAELHGKLGVPLEVRGFDERMAERRYLFAPAWATASLEGLREELATLPAVETHADEDRIHLLTVQTALSSKSIALPSRGRTTATQRSPEGGKP
ncbi:MAG: hypothetical protein JRI23_02260 [Deltaproteobacteria bacterium]|nr:hypothetical protein [Deltaproteobacteria bacterium]MBW2530305.1 hypothetical protein [Deltaproteobacteria bacterium]